MKTAALSAAFALTASMAAGIGAMVSSSLALAQEQRFVTIGTGVVTGLYYPVGGAICRLVNRSRAQHNIRCAVEATDGSVFNLTALRGGEMEMAIVQSDWQYHAYKGTARFRDDGPFKGLRSVLGLHGEPFTVVARAGAGIETFQDLKGKRVNIGPDGSGGRVMLDSVLKAMSWTVLDFSLASELPAPEQTNALCGNRVDAIVMAGGHPSGAVQEAASTCSVTLVNVSGRAIQRLIDDSPWLASTIIPGGLYPGVPKDTETFGVKATLVSSASVDADIVYEVVKTVFESLGEFKVLHPALQGLEKATMVKDGLAAPLHEGAKRYFKEAGLR
jgi:TRAP transporter TAXI family solute receptor